MAQIAAPPRFVPYSTMTDLKRRAEEEAKKKEEEDNDLELSLGLSIGGRSSSAKRQRVTAVDSPPLPEKMQRKPMLPYAHVPAFPCHVPAVPVGAPGYGIAWQYVMPALWNPAAATVGGGFPVFLAPPNNGTTAENGAGAPAAESSSHGSSASVISDRQSGSVKGSASSKAKSVTSNNSGDKNSTPEISSPSPRNSRRRRHRTHATPSTTKSINDNQSPDLELKLEPASSSPPSSEKSKTPPESQQSAPSMPHVSTTGDGPGGKTITGVLYKYGVGMSEVSIVCACHGKPFSPAEFVRHAGGTDVEHPLRQIVVLP